MRTYVIGDLHGCHAEFVALLEKLAFDPRADRLWLVGDLVNRGPGSLDCLREIKALGSAARCVLGNHDLHLLVAARGGGRLHRRDTLDDILTAPDREALLDWLQAQPLMVREGEVVMAHAGLLPQWRVERAEALAGEVTDTLGGEHAGRFLTRLFGNQPKRWHDELEGDDRLRFIVNAFTRMRFIDADGQLDFSAKEGLDSAPADFRPWFQFPRADDPRLLFGHWAALEGKAPNAAVRVTGLDTGCVWGGDMTALTLETGALTQVASQQRL